MRPACEARPLWCSQKRRKNGTSNMLIFTTLIGYGQQKCFPPKIIRTACLVGKGLNPWIRSAFITFDHVQDMACGKVFLKGAIEKAEVVTCANDKETDTHPKTFKEILHLSPY